MRTGNAAQTLHRVAGQGLSLGLAALQTLSPLKALLARRMMFGRR